MRQKTKTRKLSCMDPITVFNVRVVSRKSKAVFFVICRFASFFLGSIFRFTETAKPENRSHFFLSCFSFPVPYTSKAYIHVRKGNPDNGQPYATADSSTQHQRGAARDTAPATAATVLVAQGTALCKTAVGGCYLQSFRGKKDRSITQPRVILTRTLSPPLNGGIFLASVPCTAVRWPTRFVSIPGEPGRYVFSGTVRASVFITEMFEVRFEPRVLDDAKCEGIIYWAIGVKDRSITQFRVQGNRYNLVHPSLFVTSVWWCN